jgi:hypothetical protein
VGSQSQSGRFEEGRIFLPVPALEPDPPARSLVYMPTITEGYSA